MENHNIVIIFMAARRINLYCQILCLKRILWERCKAVFGMEFLYFNLLESLAKNDFRCLCQLINTLNVALRVIRILKL